MLAIPEFTDLDAAFGAKLRAYPATPDIPKEFYDRHNNRFCDIANALFFNGGTLAQHGLQFKAEIDRAKAMRAIKAWLCSFEPAHEHKIATVGYALSQWCEKAAETPAKQSQSRKSKKKGRR